MEKTISINIGGVIFHVEEEGYQRLRSYLNSIHKYFSDFADNKEILSDIEGRIAERFLLKMKAGGQQAISLADVEELIGAMGTVADFEAIDQGEDLFGAPAEAAPAVSEEGRPGERKGFARDLRRKLIGGVAAGLAHRYSIDPVWVRLAFIFLAVGLPTGAGVADFPLERNFGYLGIFTVLVYIAMWLAFPGSATLEEDKKIKKFYRDPDRKVVGGVAAGVASYFGVDVGVVRFLWVLSVLLFGIGIMVYLVLWVIAPVANTLTEKMEMQGEPITLSNIETNIKRGLDVSELQGREGILTRILLFPFRAVSILISGLGRLLKGVGPVFRVLIGVFMVLTGTLAILGILIGLGIVLGLSNTAMFISTPFQMMREIPGTLLFSGVIAALTPFVLVLLLGLSLLANRRVVGASVWLSLTGIWLVGIIASAISGVSFAANFSRKGHFESNYAYKMPGKVLLLDERKLEDDATNGGISVQIAGIEGRDSLKVDTRYYARGASLSDARRLAGQIRYEVAMEDSVLYFDEGLMLAEKTYFRDQSIDITVHVPFDKPFAMTRDFYFSKLSKWGNRMKNLSDYDLSPRHVDWAGLRWVIKRESGLECINLPAELVRRAEDDQGYYGEADVSDFSLGRRGPYIKHFAGEGFDKIVLNDNFSASIRQGSHFSINADGKEEDVDNLVFTVRDGVLQVSYLDRDKIGRSRIGKSRIGLVITMPSLRALELGGAARAKVGGFGHLGKFSLELTGAAMAELEAEVSLLEVDLSGAAKAILKGKAGQMEAELSGACQLNTTRMTLDRAVVEASGASRVRLGQVGELTQKADGISKIETR